VRVLPAPDEKKHRVDCGRRLRMARQKAGYTVEELSTALGISLATMYNYEKGVFGLSAYTLMLASSALSVDPLFLLTGARNVPTLPAPPRTVARLVSTLEQALAEITAAIDEHRNFYETPLVHHEPRQKTHKGGVDT
jgi:transcriptional regulator with XRE-family HTH domain